MTQILFLDESGDHNLTKIDQTHPIFVLGGVIADKKYAEGEMSEKVSNFKKEIFGTADLCLHTADFTRQRNGFERMKEKSFCENFYKKLNELIASLDIKIVACAVRKEMHFAKYGMEAIDPYHLSLNVLVERFCFEIEASSFASQGLIVAEKRDSSLDRQLDLAWLNLKISGTKYKKATEIDRAISSLNLRAKDDNLAGLEIADAVVTPIARAILKRKSRVSLEVIKGKMRKSHLGKINGFGLVILPKK
jgi:hypothetical protein